jgi:hypothetical protein
MRALRAVFAIVLVFGLAGRAEAHIGDRLYPFYELTEEDVARIDLRDVSVADWEAVIGEPSMTPMDFYADPTVGEGAPYDPMDLDYRIWLAWRRSNNTLWVGHERIDDVYINEYDGGDLSQLWRHDSLEFLVDGDHSGGDFSGSADPNWTDEERKLNTNRTAQQYVAIAVTPDGRHVGYLGAGAEWVNALPYSDGGGGAYGRDPTVAILEFYITPFDDLIWHSPEDSQVSELYPGKIIGFTINIPDFDAAPSQYRGYHTMSGSAATWRYAERFVDGLLIGAEKPTAVENSAWGRIKAAFGK